MKQISLKIKAGYANLEIAIVAVEVILQIYLMKYYVSEMKLSPTLVGLAMGIAIFWDAIIDPIMGAISDNSKAKMGRRTFLHVHWRSSFSFYFSSSFSNVFELNQWQAFLQLLITYILINSSLAILTIPHFALGAELTTDKNERTSLFGFKLLFGNWSFGGYLITLFIYY